MFAADPGSATRQAGDGVPPLPGGGPGPGRLRLLRGLPLPRAQGDPRASIGAPHRAVDLPQLLVTPLLSGHTTLPTPNPVAL